MKFIVTLMFYPHFETFLRFHRVALKYWLLMVLLFSQATSLRNNGFARYINFSHFHKGNEKFKPRSKQRSANEWLTSISYLYCNICFWAVIAWDIELIVTFFECVTFFKSNWRLQSSSSKITTLPNSSTYQPCRLNT